MISRSFPTESEQIYNIIRTGLKTRAYSKPIVARTGYNIRWLTGRHALCMHRPWPKIYKSELALLHYRFLGLEHTLNRSKRMFDGYISAAQINNVIPYDYKRNVIINKEYVDQYLAKQTRKYAEMLNVARDIFLINS